MMRRHAAQPAFFSFVLCIVIKECGGGDGGWFGFGPLWRFRFLKDGKHSMFAAAAAASCILLRL